MITDLMQKYNDELTETLKIDEFSVKDISLKLPGIKHIWVSRLINAKSDLKKLESQRTEIINKLSKHIQQESKVELSDLGAKKAAETQDIHQKVNTIIKDQEILIEYLEKIEKILSNMTWDVKNIIDLIKLETL
jgi:hypothetical protein